jgi:predicted dehydrogenase
MGNPKQLALGVVGACRRGGSFKGALDALADHARVQAVCDVDAAGLDQAAAFLGAPEKYARDRKSVV